MKSQAEGVQAELGWSLRPRGDRQRLCDRGRQELLRICFDELGLRRVTADCFAANAPSYRLMERVGMRRETSSVADGLHPSGEWMGGYGYALLADEWRARHA